MKASGGGWRNYRGKLKSLGLIEQQPDGKWYATPAGVSAAGTCADPMPPAGPELVRWWARKAPGSASNAAEVLLERYPAWTSLDELAAALDMVATGGGFRNKLSGLAGVGILERGPEGVRLADEVMLP